MKRKCEHCVDSESCDLNECACDVCDSGSEKCCSKNNKESKKKKFPKGRCRHCGIGDDYAQIEWDGMICCWECRSDGKS